MKLTDAASGSNSKGGTTPGVPVSTVLAMVEDTGESALQRLMKWPLAAIMCTGGAIVSAQTLP